MKKRIALLSLYSIIVLGVSYAFKDYPKFETVMCLFLGIIFLGLVVIFMPQTRVNRYDNPSLQYVNSLEKDKHSLNFVNILTCLFLIIPPFIALYLFG